MAIHVFARGCVAPRTVAALESIVVRRSLHRTAKDQHLICLLSSVRHFRFLPSSTKRTAGETNSKGTSTLNPPKDLIHAATNESQTDGPKKIEEHVEKASLLQLWGLLKTEHARLKLAFLALLGSSSVTLSYPMFMGALVNRFSGSNGASTNSGSVPGNDSMSATLGTLTTTPAQTGGITTSPSVIDNFLQSMNGDPDFVFYFSGVAIVGAVFTFARLYLLETSIERIQYRLRHQFFGTVLQNPDLQFYQQSESNRPPALASRLNSDIGITSRVLLDVSQMARTVLSAGFSGFMVLKLAPPEMYFSFLMPACGFFGCIFVYGRLVRRIASKRQEILASSIGNAEERFAMAETVKLFNREEHEILRFSSKLDQVYTVGRQNALMQAGFSSIIVGGGGLFLLSIAHNCGMLIQSGALSSGTTVSLGMYLVMAGSGLSGIAGSYAEIQKCLGACSKVLSIIGHEPDLKTSRIDASDEGVKHQSCGRIVPGRNADGVSKLDNAPRSADPFNIATSKGGLSLSFQNVDFQYSSRPDVQILNGLSIDIPAGARIGILGSSGSGKSTLAALSSGLYSPTGGKILVNGVSLRSPGSDDDNTLNRKLREHVGVISQEPSLFNMSIRENILYGFNKEQSITVHENEGRLRDKRARGEIEPKDAQSTTNQEEPSPQQILLKNAIDVAHLREFISKLGPGGLDSAAGERGSSLSGGQKQRVCIARALIRAPHLLIFDEATSALDMQSEKIVQAALTDIMQAREGGHLDLSRCTCMVITHRLSTLEFVDLVAVMDGGKIVQYGKREEVFANPCESLAKMLQ